MNLILFLLYIY
jgi:aryl-alcohol dehydrogenase-like predicted oxidoreductase